MEWNVMYRFVPCVFSDFVSLKCHNQSKTVQRCTQVRYTTSAKMGMAKASTTWKRMRTTDKLTYHESLAYHHVPEGNAIDCDGQKQHPTDRFRQSTIAAKIWQLRQSDAKSNMSCSQLCTRFVGSARGGNRFSGDRNSDHHHHHHHRHRRSAAATGGNSFYTERTKAEVTSSALIGDQFDFRQVEPLNEQNHND